MDDLTNNHMEFPTNWQELATDEQAGNQQVARPAVARFVAAQSVSVSDPLETFHRSTTSAGRWPVARGMDILKSVLICFDAVGAVVALVLLVLWILRSS